MWAAFPKFCIDKARPRHHLIFNAAAKGREAKGTGAKRFPCISLLLSLSRQFFLQGNGASCFCCAWYERLIIFHHPRFEKWTHPKQYATVHTGVWMARSMESHRSFHPITPGNDCISKRGKKKSPLYTYYLMMQLMESSHTTPTEIILKASWWDWA